MTDYRQNEPQILSERRTTQATQKENRVEIHIRREDYRKDAWQHPEQYQEAFLTAGWSLYEDNVAVSVRFEDGTVYTEEEVREKFLDETFEPPDHLFPCTIIYDLKDEEEPENHKQTVEEEPNAAALAKVAAEVAKADAAEENLANAMKTSNIQQLKEAMMCAFDARVPLMTISEGEKKLDELLAAKAEEESKATKAPEEATRAEAVLSGKLDRLREAFKAFAKAAEAEAKPHKCEDFAKGSRVRTVGLQNVNYNNRTGVIKTSQGERWIVKLDGGEGEKAFKVENLKLEKGRGGSENSRIGEGVPLMTISEGVKKLDERVKKLDELLAAKAEEESKATKAPEEATRAEAVLSGKLDRLREALKAFAKAAEAEAKPHKCEDFAKGSRVRTVGLQNVNYNNRTGVIKASQGERWIVKLDGGEGEKAFKVENLKLEKDRGGSENSRIGEGC